MRVWRVVIFFSLLVTAIVFAGQNDASRGFSGYRSWTKANEKPIHMAPQIAALCRIPTKWESSQDNLHNDKFFTVYVNEKGRKAMFASTVETFPVGSMIAKEKLSSEKGKVELITAMIKRERGFDAANGDWEYLLLSGDGKKVLEDKKTAHCRSCHLEAKGNDFVFRNYMAKAPRVPIKY